MGGFLGESPGTGLLGVQPLCPRLQFMPWTPRPILTGPLENTVWGGSSEGRCWEPAASGAQMGAPVWTAVPGVAWTVCAVGIQRTGMPVCAGAAEEGGASWRKGDVSGGGWVAC